MMCSKCNKISGLILLALGVVFLLRDFNIWAFWNISWWSAVLVVVGFIKFCKGSCPDCCAMPSGKRR